MGNPIPSALPGRSATGERSLSSDSSRTYLQFKCGCVVGMSTGRRPAVSGVHRCAGADSRCVPGVEAQACPSNRGFELLRGFRNRFASRARTMSTFPPWALWLRNTKAAHTGGCMLQGQFLKRCQARLQSGTGRYDCCMIRLPAVGSKLCCSPGVFNSGAVAEACMVTRACIRTQQPAEKRLGGRAGRAGVQGNILYSIPCRREC